MYTFYHDDAYRYMQENKETIKDEIKENNEALYIDDDMLYRQAADDLDYLYYDLVNCLKEYDLKNDNKILIVASLGLWYGRRQATAVINNLYNAVHKCLQDQNELYFEKNNTTLNIKASHHDGVNYYKLYKLVNGRKYAIKLNDLLACY